MIPFQVLGQRLQAELFVFDKDGLLFDSEIFWKEIASVRVRNLVRLVELQMADSSLTGVRTNDFRLAGSESLADQWLRLMGVEFDTSGGSGMERVNDWWVDHLGILAAASPDEEITVTAGFLAEHLHLPWVEARDISRKIFETSDRELDFKKALKPMEGFPGIFRRLRERGVPYGIATSDNHERAEESIRLFDEWEAVRFVITPRDVSRGKPDREMLDKISELTQVNTSKMVMIGDSYLDVSMAKAAGAIGIGVTKDPDMKERMQDFTPWIVESLEQIIL